MAIIIIGYVFGIRSERLLCREVKVNMAYRWFCDLSIEDNVPDHSAFSRARNERFVNKDIFRRVFEHVVAGVHQRRAWWAVPGLCCRCEPDRRRCQQAAVDPGQRMGQGSRPGNSEPGREGVSVEPSTPQPSARRAMSRPGLSRRLIQRTQWTGAMRGPAFFAYADNYLIDVKFGIIMDVEASRAIRQAEVGAAKSMIE